MAIRSRTLTQLRDAVADRADVAVSASGVRHTETLVDARLNRAIQRWVNLCAQCGDDTRLVTTRTATATSTTRDAANWAPYQYVAQPSGCEIVRGIDVWLSGVPYPLIPQNEMERADAFDELWSSGGTGLPRFYRLGGTNNAGDLLIQIFPWADAVYTVDVRYIPAHTDLTSGSQTVDFICGGEEWVANDAAMQTLINDQLAGTPAFAAMAAMNMSIEKDARFTLGCRNPITKQSATGRREAARMGYVRRA